MKEVERDNLLFYKKINKKMTFNLNNSEERVVIAIVVG